MPCHVYLPQSLAEVDQKSQRGESVSFDFSLVKFLYYIIHNYLLYYIVYLCDITALCLPHCPGGYVPPHPSETAQHHSLHHRQRPPSGLLQRQGPRVAQGRRGHSSSVPVHRTWGLRQRKGPKPRFAIGSPVVVTRKSNCIRGL